MVDAEKPQWTPETFLAAALKHVESRGMKAQAQGDHDRPIWLKYAEHVLARGANDPLKFGCYITLTYLG